jgi:hypothetical protein
MPMAESSAGGVTMNGFIQLVERITVRIDGFLWMFYTAKHHPVVLTTVKSREEIQVECRTWGSPPPPAGRR